MVLSPSEQHGGFAVAQREDRRLLAGHEFLDDDMRRGGTVAPTQHCLDLGDGVRIVRRNRDALAGGQAIGLDDVRRLIGFQEFPSFGDIVERL